MKECSSVAGHDVGIVVPTLGTRPDYLRECLSSIRAAGDALIHVVVPAGVSLPDGVTPDMYDLVIPDPGKGLAAAIHEGMSSFPESVVFVNWLGDDDVLAHNSIRMTSHVLKTDESASFVFGGCRYVDEIGQTIFVNKSGKYALPLMRFGPQLIPQPGALIRRSSYIEIGGLNCTYRWAFDLDLFIRLSKVGRGRFLNSDLASFRWHADSLSVGGREGSVNEASKIRKYYLPLVLRTVSELWEFPLRKLILFAGTRVSRAQMTSIN